MDSPASKIKKKQAELQAKFYDILDSKSKETIRHADIGKYQWCTKTFNIQKSSISCPNRCIYCYAIIGALRFKRQQDIVTKTISDEKKVNKGWMVCKNNREPDEYMFPSTHDIFDENVDDYIKVAKKMLAAGHNILCTTKPRLSCIKKICSEIRVKKDEFEFRFTIGSGDQKTLSIWEPNAPKLSERLESLLYAHKAGFVTSVSMEPCLDDPTDFVKTIAPYCDTIWIGFMNHIKKYGDIEECYITSLLSDKNIKKVVNNLRTYKNVYWKESVILQMMKI